MSRFFPKPLTPIIYIWHWHFFEPSKDIDGWRGCCQEKLEPHRNATKLQPKEYPFHTVLTNYHRLNSVKVHKLIILQVWRLDKIKMWVGLRSFGGSMGKSTSLPFQLLEKLPLFFGSLFLPPSSNLFFSLFHFLTSALVISFTLTLPFLFTVIKQGPPTGIAQHNLSISWCLTETYLRSLCAR